MEASFCAKTIKEKEKNIYSNIYTNLLLLTHKHRPSKDFLAVFKPEMFDKPNKATFHQVVHYLLLVFDEKLTREKITNWPLFETKQESGFRQQVLSVIEHIKSHYEYANIPNLMSSMMIVPQGMKIAKFLWRLSMFVMHEELSKDQKLKKSLLLPSDASCMTKLLTSKLEHATRTIRKQSQQAKDEFMKCRIEARLKSTEMIEKQKKLQCLLKNNLAELNKKQADFGSTTVIASKLDEIKLNIVSLQSCRKRCEELAKLNQLLEDNELTLECTEEDSKRDSLKNVVTVNKLILHKLMEKLILLLETEDFPGEEALSKSNAEYLINFISGINKQYEILEEELCEDFKILQELGKAL